VLLTELAGRAMVRRAAERAGLSERTAHRRLAEADFRRRVAELRAEMVARAMGRLVDGMTEAADTLRKLLRAEGESVRPGAARTILELGNRLREAVELEERLSALERRIADGQARPLP
jgi:hypothetical protein